ncbi:homeobox protein NOBOX [Lepisosteus oculatus]|uniref:homeobox protein NOBOX n=1 Tax=Lepisosteus oculatus TaxID=7918 RepID=UPI0035F52974
MEKDQSENQESVNDFEEEQDSLLCKEQLESDPESKAQLGLRLQLSCEEDEVVEEAVAKDVKAEAEEEEEEGIRREVTDVRETPPMSAYRTVIIDSEQAGGGPEESSVVSSEEDFCVLQVEGRGTPRGSGQFLGQPSMEPESQMNFVTVCGRVTGLFDSRRREQAEEEFSSLPTPYCQQNTSGSYHEEEHTPQLGTKRPRQAAASPAQQQTEGPIKLEQTEASSSDPALVIPSKVLNLTEFQPVDLKINSAYVTRRHTRYSSRAKVFPNYRAAGGGAALGDSRDGLKQDELADSGLMPPVPKKKTRTLYTTEQLEELERLFHEDHYPDGDKRKEIAAAIGVTPQRIMVWFQNRRAKWRKTEKSNLKQEKKSSASSMAVTLTSTIAVPQVSSHIALTAPPAGGGVLATVHSQPIVPRIVPQPNQSHFSGVMTTSSSPPGLMITGHRMAAEMGQATLASAGQQGAPMDYLPCIPSPPPLRRASLPLGTSFNPTNHIIPLMLDTPESSGTQGSQEGPPREGLSYSLHSESSGSNTSSLCDYNEHLGTSVKVDTQHYLHSNPGTNQLASYQLSSFPQQHSNLLPTHSLNSGQLPQYQRLPYLNTSCPPSASLAPTPPVDSNPSYLAFGAAGNTGVMTYASGGRAYFQTQGGNQILLQQGVHGGITTFQAFPWNDIYGQPSQYAPTLYQRAPYQGLAREQSLYQQAPSLMPTQRYIQVQRPAAGSAQNLFQGTQRILPAPAVYQPPRPMRAEFPAPESSECQDTPAGTKEPDSSNSKSDCDSVQQTLPEQVTSQQARGTESDTTFECDFSPIHF